MPFKVSDSFIEENQVVAVLTGGTEAQFVDLVKQKKIDLKRPVYLMVSGYSNSLAASFEILSFIRQRNGIAKVMTHAKDTVFPDVSETDSLTRSPLEKVLKNEKKQRLGIIGKPSDWLIASQVDYNQVLKDRNIELVDIPIEEVVETSSSAHKYIPLILVAIGIVLFICIFIKNMIYSFIEIILSR